MSEFLETELGSIPSHWSGKPIGEMAFVTKLAGYEYTKFFKYIDDGEIIALRALNVREGNLDLTQLKRISKEVSDALPRSKLIKGDILFTYVGANIGQFALINENNKYHLAPNICLIRPNKNCDAYFVYSYFRTNFFRENLSNYSVGSSQPTLPMGNIRKIILPCPPIEEQKAIASVLSSLDDKIDLLHRQNTTLERMAETLFRQWFVEEAQEDWEECTLDDLISVKGGTTPSTKEPSFWNGNVNWTSPRDLSNQQSVFMFDTERKITEKGLAQIGSGLLPIGTVLMSSRAPIGYLAISDIPVAINQGYIAIICDKLVSNYFMYLWCKVNMEQIKNSSNGSTFEEISKSNFKALSTLKPSEEAILKFSTSAEPIFAKIKTNQQQIQALEKLRDNLLPKLMSGDVRVTLN